jgi:hypothetical protein
MVTECHGLSPLGAGDESLDFGLIRGETTAR